MDEEWIEVENYDGDYMVSSHGRVQSRKNGARKMLRPRVCDKTGHLQVALYKKGRVRYVLVHRLVATAFIPNEKKFREVDHLNGNAEDNHVGNLRWVPAYINSRNRKVSPMKDLPLGIDKKRNCFRTRVRAGGQEMYAQFSIVKYGREKALQMAIEARSRMEDAIGGYLASYNRRKEFLPPTVTVHNYFL